jgi:hypothetical protein
MRSGRCDQCFGIDTFTLEICHGFLFSRILRSQACQGASGSVWPVASRTVQADRGWKMKTQAAA